MLVHLIDVDAVFRRLDDPGLQRRVDIAEWHMDGLRAIGRKHRMMNSKVEGAHTLALGTMGFRDIYSKREIHRLEDLKNVKAGPSPNSPSR
jgi:TRAP-type C4-dicarboxylate transport system substrate-binding protein